MKLSCSKHESSEGKKPEFVQWKIIKGENFFQKVEEHSNALAKLKRTWIEKKNRQNFHTTCIRRYVALFFSSLVFPLFIFSSAACACVSPRSIYKWIRAIKWMDEWNASAFFLKTRQSFFALQLCVLLLCNLFGPVSSFVPHIFCSCCAVPTREFVHLVSSRII